MTGVKKAATALRPVVNSVWYNVALIVVLILQLVIRHEALIVLAMGMIFLYCGVQLLVDNLTKRQRMLYWIILGLNAASVILLAWATFG